MNDGLILVAIAAVALFVLIKGIQIIIKLFVLSPKAAPQAPFESDDVVRHARNLFLRVQRAWDAKDMVTLETLVTPSALEELEAQAVADKEFSVTEILYVSAAIISHEQDDAKQTAQILFDVVLREEALPEPANQADRAGATSGVASSPGVPDNPVRIREVWHILYVPGDDGWRVDAIQQVR